MPNSASSEKRLRQNHSRRDANRATRSKLRTYIRRVHEATEAYEAAVAADGDAEAALTTVNEAYRDAQIKIDKAGAKSLIHKNKAARTKSRLQKMIKKAKGIA